MKKKILAVCLAAAACVLLSTTIQTKSMQRNMAQKVLRFHVLANSDSTLDQEMKLCVRNEILEFLQTEMPTGAGAEATKECVIRWER